MQSPRHSGLPMTADGLSQGVLILFFTIGSCGPTLPDIFPCRTRQHFPEDPLPFSPPGAFRKPPITVFLADTIWSPGRSRRGEIARVFRCAHRRISTVRWGSFPWGRGWGFLWEEMPWCAGFPIRGPMPDSRTARASPSRICLWPPPGGAINSPIFSPRGDFPGAGIGGRSSPSIRLLSTMPGSSSPPESPLPFGISCPHPANTIFFLKAHDRGRRHFLPTATD